MTVKIPDPTFYVFDSLVPTWLVEEAKAYMDEYIRSMMRHQEYHVLSTTVWEQHAGPGVAAVPIGTTLLRAQAAVREWDLEVG